MTCQTFIEAINLPHDGILPNITTDYALAAILLDDAGFTPQHLATGIHLIVADKSLHKAIRDCIVAAMPEQNVCIKTTDWNIPRNAILVVPDSDLSSNREQRTFDAAIAQGNVIIALVEPNESPNKQIKDALDHTWQMAGTMSAAHVGAVIRAVLGVSATVIFETEARPDVQDVLVSVRPGYTPQRCLEKMRSVLAVRELCGDDGQTYSGDAEPIGDAAEKVITRLRDLSGYGDAKTWGMRLADDMHAYKTGDLDWDDIDRGILISGPPGCGKSYFARALAAECEIPLIVTGYGDWAAHKGGGDSICKAIKAVFDEARKKAPCIVFIDEIDGLGVRGDNAHNESFWTAIINALLAELDGAIPRTGIIVCAATNNPDRVDPALKRAGRLDRHVVIPQPTIEDLRGVIMHCLGAGADDRGLSEAAIACRGMSPAEIAQAARAARRIARTCKRKVCAGDVSDAVRMMRKPREAMADRTTCIHEAGHALVAALLGVKIEYVDVDRNQCAVLAPDGHSTRQNLEHGITIAFGGRAANALLSAGETAGAIADIEIATVYAVSIVGQLGLDTTLMRVPPEAMFADRNLLRRVEEILSTCDERARLLLSMHEDKLIALADALGERRYMTGAEVKALVDDMQAAHWVRQ